ncbi:MAG: GIY-YIG nuclease family protein [Verrucomicrobiales bacterium]|nr:GIY-YIG nuclease family protein [Verrucomicrobiales bacterium]
MRYTQEGKEIIKIGITTIDVETRIGQLYTTGVPFRFRVICKKDTKNFYELEQSIHKLLAPYRINRAREFFTDDCLPHVEKIVQLHFEIQAATEREVN